ncbi:MAG: hypothetical protein IT245_00730 [Bacteroidia bacterium]|nr:hypothetical protein [Bacteroidia bacterium]
MDNKFESHHSHSLFWSAVGHGNRVSVISDCEKIINDLGFIIEFKKFSDLALSLQIDIQADRILILYNALKKVLNLDPFDTNEINEHIKTVFLNISFADGHGDLRIEVPDVPG